MMHQKARARGCDNPRRKTAKVKMICGHWAALGLVQRDNLLALDTGAFWRGRLTVGAVKTLQSRQPVIGHIAI